MSNILKNLNFTKFIDDNVLLAQTISLILYFESYNLIFYNMSIGNMSFDIDKITILPIITLLATIATSKVIWFIIVCRLPLKFTKGSKEISVRTSYSSFILTLSLILFLYLSCKEQALFLISYNNQPFLFSFLAISFTGGLLGGGYVFLSYAPKLGGWN